ncbi:uncharacterized protein AMSG_02774 [Thecamonas trahens ATCC 50062]|uniref:GHMP kinase N-terminal domain-containing protein n=1 Tax=Thecamonas trahens ATCC 50062 TaxID=461836 RepID=A0A0L0D218_THETB|nr:hypothetical protein AMSG_02774 [Thecamonas trahens ATCC 50062]KNC46322.1 hypothetical protein AMSG_02774 [Thecamonas trahens ATCC 50062]|eukprot:XP_013760615.1 hypothetical protein AMSG_02774 [Thecamonas trahens ATCC 50062]
MADTARSVPQRLDGTALQDVLRYQVLPFATGTEFFSEAAWGMPGHALARVEAALSLDLAAFEAAVARAVADSHCGASAEHAAEDGAEHSTSAPRFTALGIAPPAAVRPTSAGAGTSPSHLVDVSVHAGESVVGGVAGGLFDIVSSATDAALRILAKDTLRTLNRGVSLADWVSMAQLRVLQLSVPASDPHAPPLDVYWPIAVEVMRFGMVERWLGEQPGTHAATAATAIADAVAADGELAVEASVADLVASFANVDGAVGTFASTIYESLTALLRAELSSGRGRLLQQRLIMAVADVTWALRKFLALEELSVSLAEYARVSALLRAALEACGRSNPALSAELVASFEAVAEAERAGSADVDDASREPETEQPNEEAFFRFLNPFLMAANGVEVDDVHESLMAAAAAPDESSSGPRWFDDTKSGVVSMSGMRIGISSANASDNWTSAKLGGGSVLNMAVNINGTRPLCAKVSRVQAPLPGLCLTTTHWNGSGERVSALLVPESALENPSVAAAMTRAVAAVTDVEPSVTCESDAFMSSDPNDPLRFLRFALEFTGIVIRRRTAPILEQLAAFTGAPNAGGAYALCVDIINSGPSRSGFASSSAVAVNLLGALYAACGSAVADDPILLGSHVLLFENVLGLKSGRQDVDGVLPGLKLLHYAPTETVLVPSLPCTVGWVSEAAERATTQSLLVVDTGIQRTAVLDYRRGLNSRHMSYLRRKGKPYAAIVASLGIHAHIVQAFRFGRIRELGECFTAYMGLRAIIDPGAVSSIYDTDASGKVLLELFSQLKTAGLSHGGMFTGAMGGGVALVVLTDTATALRPQLDAILKSLAAWAPPLQNSRPYRNLHIIDTSPDLEGVVTDTFTL